jgi:hypothetical protein
MLESYLPSGEEGLSAQPLCIPFNNITAPCQKFSFDVMFTAAVLVVRGRGKAGVQSRSRYLGTSDITFHGMFPHPICVPGVVLFPQGVGTGEPYPDPDRAFGYCLRIDIDLEKVLGPSHILIRAGYFVTAETFHPVGDSSLELSQPRIVQYGYPGKFPAAPVLLTSGFDFCEGQWVSADTIMAVNVLTSGLPVLVVCIGFTKEEPEEVRITGVNLAPTAGSSGSSGSSGWRWLAPTHTVADTRLLYAVFDLSCEDTPCEPAHLDLMFGAVASQEQEFEMDQGVFGDIANTPTTVEFSVDMAWVRDGAAFEPENLSEAAIFVRAILCRPFALGVGEG